MATTSTPPLRDSDGDVAGFEHVTVERDGGPTELTIFPRDCDEDAILTHWITASEGSFVDLAETR
ncbi:MAG: DUF7511 domain-containing protein [Haloferacaceae archaeon]